MIIHPTYDRHAPATWGQLVFLIAMMLLMAGVQAFLIQPLVMMLPLAETPQLMLLQIFSSLLVFLVPALLTNTYYKIRTQQRFFHPTAPVSRLNLILSLAIILLAYLPSTLLEDLIELIPEPEGLRGISAALAETTEMLVSDSTPLGMTLAIVALVIAAPLAEELLFRGALQQWMLSQTRQGHAAVWIVAVIFSLIHLEWAGFLSRLLMGVILGYCALYGGLKVSILAHAVNNLLVYLLMHFGAEEGWGACTPMVGNALAILMSIVCIGVIGVLLYYMSQRTRTKYYYEPMD